MVIYRKEGDKWVKTELQMLKRTADNKTWYDWKLDQKVFKKISGKWTNQI